MYSKAEGRGELSTLPANPLQYPGFSEVVKLLWLFLLWFPQIPIRRLLLSTQAAAAKQHSSSVIGKGAMYTITRRRVAAAVPIEAITQLNLDCQLTLTESQILQVQVYPPRLTAHGNPEWSG